MAQRRFADIIVNISHEKLDHTFQYLVPERLAPFVKPGAVVQIPFGRANRPTKGYVVALCETPKCEPGKIKEIAEVLAGEETGEDRLVALAAWMRERYGSTMAQAFKTVFLARQKVVKKEKQTVCLLLSPQEAQERLAFYRKKKQMARYRLLAALLEQPEIPSEIVTGKLSVPMATVRALAGQGLLALRAESPQRAALSAPKTELNAEQTQAVAAIREGMRAPGSHTFLLYGVTGSGKTEVYMEVIAKVLQEGRQAIVLIPEISLTYQTWMRFYRRFQDRVATIHSKLSAGERYQLFQRAKAGEIDVMIGPRSALFTPFANLGLIVVDEEHEPSYQSETAPRYHARETAIARARIEGADVVLGSATPSLEAYSRALAGEYGLLTLKNRASAGSLAQTTVVDMRAELRKGNRSILGETLREAIRECLGQGRQAMLFLNRRGYSGFLSCRSCGHVLMCPHCDVSLSLHAKTHLVCHYCGHQERKPARCPHCGSEFLGGFGVGTQQAQEMVQKDFPHARLLRMDFDTTRSKDGHEKILSAFANQEADILIGTQMIAKGHDFPNVTLVGILAADLTLFVDDYRAAERTFQLITQAAGRSGRGKDAGKVVLQTYDPEHYCIRTAAAQDYVSFYEEEMSYRMVAGYPPARKMLSIQGACRDHAHLQTAMEYLKKRVLAIYRKSAGNVLGPADGPIAKIQDSYRMVLRVKADAEEELVALKDRLEQYIEANAGYQNVSVVFRLE